MFQPAYLANQTWSERIRAGFGRSATGFAAALALEAVLLLLLLSLGRSEKPPQPKGVVLTTFNTKSQPDEPDKPAPPARKAEKSTVQPPPQPSQQQPAPPVPAPAQAAPAQPALIQLSHNEMAAADISRFAKSAPPSAEKAPAYGPPDTGTPGDTPRVGTAPNGQPMYAAAWYRKPYPGELRGYLSTAQHPGWGLIACKTAPNFRVEDCVTIDEYPDHSNYANAVAAAAWQFKVRPPRVGGMPVIGAWVQIRIYDSTGKTDEQGAQ